MITSRQNPKVKQWAALSSKKERELSSSYLIEGEHLVQEALSLGQLKLLIKSEDYKGYLEFEPCELVSKEVAEKLSQTKSSSPIFGIVFIEKKKPVGNRWLYLQNIQDPGNVGTLIRSAVSFGYTTILYSDTTADPYSDKVVRSAQGAHFHINLVKVNDKELIDIIKEYSIDLVTTYLSEGSNHEMPRSNFCLALGNEGAGLSDSLKDYSNMNVLVKMGNFESLNVGVAGSILMYLSQ